MRNENLRPPYISVHYNRQDTCLLRCLRYMIVLRDVDVLSLIHDVGWPLNNVLGGLAGSILSAGNPTIQR
jgi:hypothetical protein